MNLHQVVDWMMEQGYLVSIKGKYKVTAKFNKEIVGEETGLVKFNNTLLVQEHAPPQITGNNINWPEVFIKFIQEAEVPARGEGGNGSYDLNKYSDPAMKVFRRMIEKEKIIYAVLVKSTMLYYKTHRKFPYTISRYIVEGFWRSDYFSLFSSAEEGKVQEHIQKEIDNGTEFSRFRTG